MEYLFPNEINLEDMKNQKPMKPFSDVAIDFLNRLSKEILSDPTAKTFPDLVTFAFWCRKANVISLSNTYDDIAKRIGRGLVFHISPSNVPLNFAYSFVAGFLSGNSNIIRIPSKAFPQIDVFMKAFHKASETDKNIINSCAFVRYERDEKTNSFLSALCDVRIIWGGDNSIKEIRKSALPPHAFDVTFVDRYSFCVINAKDYVAYDKKQALAMDFYNDTFLFDQNACTAPHLVVWVGNDADIATAKDLFWKELYQVTSERYKVEGVQAVDKLIALYRCAANGNCVESVPMPDNLIVRAKVHELWQDIANYRSTCGYFYEFDTKSIDGIKPVLSRKVQTIAYFGFKENELQDWASSLEEFGIDRFTPIGKTLDFSLFWDGYDLIRTLSRFRNFVKC